MLKNSLWNIKFSLKNNRRTAKINIHWWMYLHSGIIWVVNYDHQIYLIICFNISDEQSRVFDLKSSCVQFKLLSRGSWCPFHFLTYNAIISTLNLSRFTRANQKENILPLCRTEHVCRESLCHFWLMFRCERLLYIVH